MHNIEIRALSTVTTNHRVQWDSRNFYIQNIINMGERGINMVLECEERL